MGGTDYTTGDSAFQKPRSDQSLWPNLGTLEASFPTDCPRKEELTLSFFSSSPHKLEALRLGQE